MDGLTRIGRRAALTVGLLVLGSGIFVACASDDDGNGGDGDNGGTTTTATSTATAGGGGGADVDNEMEIEIIFGDNFFDPSEITVPAGTRVKFEYENQGAAIHNMIVMSQETEGENFQSPTIVNPGESGEFEATFTTAGTMSFICAYHQPDMTGTLTVE